MKTILGCVAAAAALLSAPTAAADINFSGINIGIGDGQAEASFGNVAAAFNGGEAKATGGFGNIAVANGGGARVQGGVANLAVGQRGIASTIDSNATIAVAGPNSTAAVNNSNLAVAFARGNGPGGPSDGSQANVTDTNLNVQIAFCGGSAISAQSDRINVSGDCR